MVVGAKIVGASGEDRSVGHNILANTLALQVHQHLNLEEGVNYPRAYSLLVGIEADYLGNLGQAVPLGVYASHDLSKTWY